MPDRPEISIIIPVLDEAERINHVIDAIGPSNPGRAFETIVVDGDPAGRTIKSISGDGVVKLLSGTGRAKQMNAGAQAATGEILLFLHADTELPTGALGKIASAMEDPAYVAGAFDLAIDSSRAVFRIIERAASLRSRLTGTPFGDQAIFIRKDYFHTIGGYKDIPIMEDIKLMRRVANRDGRLCFLADKVRTSPRRWEKEGVLRCTLRNWLIQFLYAVGVSPHRLARFYRNHSTLPEDVPEETRR
jgi:rSAM/selenodomain-associated transferase 2